MWCVLLGEEKLAGRRLPGWLKSCNCTYCTFKVGLNHAIVHVDGDQISLRFLKFLDSEDDAEHPMSWAVWGWAGLGCLVVTFRGKTTKAWISSDKNRIHGGIPDLQPFDKMTWISAVEAALIRSRPKQSVAAPELPFPLNPGECHRTNERTQVDSSTQVTRASFLSSLGPLALASPPQLRSSSSWSSGFTTRATGSLSDSTPICPPTKARLMHGLINRL